MSALAASRIDRAGVARFAEAYALTSRKGGRLHTAVGTGFVALRLAAGLPAFIRTWLTEGQETSPGSLYAGPTACEAA